MAPPLARGVDADRVAGWLAEHGVEVAGPLRVELLSGGRSNLTFTLTDAAGQVLVLRRPPLGMVLPTAHDVTREHRILAALQGTGLPLPRVIGAAQDGELIGAPFYVMEFVPGRVLRDAAEAATLLPESARRRLSMQIVELLARLHALDVDAVALGDLGRREGYIERQLRRWQGQWEASRIPGLAAVDEVHHLLAGRVPPQQGVAIVHGDYALHNLLVSVAGEVTAILDWELCTLGDPLADLGMLLARWPEPGEDLGGQPPLPSTAQGFASRAELLQRYEAISGRDVSRIAFYVAFAMWKLACIGAGVYARYHRRVMGDVAVDVESLRRTVIYRAEAAHRAAAELA